MSNRCPLCSGLGRVLAFGLGAEPAAMRCPECAGLSLVPASADDPAPEPAFSIEAGTGAPPPKVECRVDDEGNGDAQANLGRRADSGG